VNHLGRVGAAVASTNGRLLMTASDDGTARFWHVRRSATDPTRLLLTRAAVDSTDWVAVTPAGRFEGSQGAIRQLHYVRGFQAVALDAFVQRYYTPGLSGRVLSDSARSSGTFAFKPPPAMSIRVTPERAGAPSGRPPMARVVFSARDAGGGVQSLQLFQNGTLVAGTSDAMLIEARGDSTLSYETPRGARFDCSAECTVRVSLVPGLNVFEAAATATDGTAAERAVGTAVGGGTAATSRLFIMSVAVATYENTNSSLDFPIADATSFVAAVDTGASGIFASIEKHELYGEAATPAAISAIFDTLAKRIRPTDVFVFYYAGHASVTGERFFIALNGFSFDDPSTERDHTVGEAVLRRKIDAIPALKKVVIMDACRSGTLVNRGLTAKIGETPRVRGTGKTRGLEIPAGAAPWFGQHVSPLSEQQVAEQQAVAQLSRSSGVFAIAAASPSESAIEFEGLQHGLFTYAFLQALAADPSGVPRVRTIREISNEVERRVPELAQRYGRALQFPLIWSNGHDFPIVVR
jgi:hypothetical protein